MHVFHDPPGVSRRGKGLIMIATGGFRCYTTGAVGLQILKSIMTAAHLLRIRTIVTGAGF